LDSRVDHEQSLFLFDSYRLFDITECPESELNASGQSSGLSPLKTSPIKQLAELTASDATANFYFGHAVAISSSIAVVGATATSISQLGQGAADVLWAGCGLRIC
jgi:hypothetical protein